MSTVKKTIKMDSALAESISSYARAVDIDFSEALRRLVRKGLSTSPGYPFAAPHGAQIGLEDVINEIHRTRSELSQEIQEVLDEFLIASIDIKEK